MRRVLGLALLGACVVAIGGFTIYVDEIASMPVAALLAVVAIVVAAPLVAFALDMVFDDWGFW